MKDPSLRAIMERARADESREGERRHRNRMPPLQMLGYFGIGFAILSLLVSIFWIPIPCCLSIYVAIFAMGVSFVVYSRMFDH
ncbi:MAG: hypothetical protein ACRC7O_10450 [Fimbriiglobus sp.]